MRTDALAAPRLLRCLAAGINLRVLLVFTSGRFLPSATGCASLSAGAEIWQCHWHWVSDLVSKSDSAAQQTECGQRRRSFYAAAGLRCAMRD